VASYRDPDLVSTLSDCLAKANHPDSLHFVVCWQHGPEEQLPDWMAIDVSPERNGKSPADEFRERLASLGYEIRRCAHVMFAKLEPGS
jgi:hypothetical protein